MKRILYILFFVMICSYSYGQKSFFYDDNGSLKVNADYKLDPAKFEVVNKIERYLLEEILPTMEYPSLSINLCITGKGLLKLNIINEDLELILLKGIASQIDQYVKEKIEPLKDFIEKNSITENIEMYIGGKKRNVPEEIK